MHFFGGEVCSEHVFNSFLNQMELGVIRILVHMLCLSFAQALLASSGQDKSMRLEAHMVSANSRYIEEQQEQQQVEGNIGGRMEGERKRESREWKKRRSLFSAPCVIAKD